MHVQFPVNAESCGFIGANQDSYVLKIWSFVSTYTYVCVLLGYCVYFTEAVCCRDLFHQQQ